MVEQDAMLRRHSTGDNLLNSSPHPQSPPPAPSLYFTEKCIQIDMCIIKMLQFVQYGVHVIGRIYIKYTI